MRQNNFSKHCPSASPAFPCPVRLRRCVASEIMGATQVRFISETLVPVEEIRGMCITSVVGCIYEYDVHGYFWPSMRTEWARVEGWSFQGRGAGAGAQHPVNFILTARAQSKREIDSSWRSDGRCQVYGVREKEREREREGLFVINLAALPSPPSGAANWSTQRSDAPSILRAEPHLDASHRRLMTATKHQSLSGFQSLDDDLIGAITQHLTPIDQHTTSATQLL